MDIILIDGVKYHEWTPSSEDELERMVVEHAQDIFGEKSIYLDLKPRLKSRSGIVSIPDGYVVVLGDSPQWHIVEVELSNHPLYEHIVPQVSRFISGIRNPSTQREIADAIHNAVDKDAFLKLKLKKAIEPAETYKFLLDIVSKPPVLTIIIERKDTGELTEALETLSYSQNKVVEFRTFVREGAESVHAHLFKPLYAESSSDGPRAGVIKIGTQKEEGQRSGKRVTVKDLIDANMVKIGQVIYRSYNGRRFEGRILSDGNVELLHNGKKLSLNRAASDVTGGAVDAWTWWYILRENGEECLLDECRKEYLSKQSS